MRIQDLFLEARKEGRKLFIPYITAGDPDLEATAYLVEALAAQGADLIELGVPFSDPVADGPTNQLAAQRALKNKVSLRDCCALVRRLRQRGCTLPLVLFTYLNPIYQCGLQNFAALAADCGVDAVLIVDLPIEEAGELSAILKEHQLGQILLLTPTTSVERIQKTADLAPEFLYYVSRTGVTGAQSVLSSTLAKEIARVREQTDLPLAIGFGISTPLQVRAAASLSDGVIAGSVLVKELEAPDPRLGLENLLKVAAQLRAGLDPEVRT